MSQSTSPRSAVVLDPRPARLLDVTPYAAPAEIPAEARLLVHEMPSAAGAITPATSLLFVPRQEAPQAGWPVVAWVHGTTTGGQRLRAPSLSATLDGDLTADGAVTGYVAVVRDLVAAGFAVVAPDLEGLGPVAEVPVPYYSASSLARSLVAGVQAARQADGRLSRAWAAVGHSEGGHGSLATESYSAEAPDLDFVGAVAFAPFTSVSAIVAFHGDQAVRHPAAALDHVTQQNFNVALIAAGVQVSDPSFELSTIMGADLEELMSSVTAKGSVPIVHDIVGAIEARTIARFAGFKPGWESVPAVRAYVEANDLALLGYHPRRPTLLLQGGDDISIPEEITTAFVTNLGEAGGAIDYRRYPASDHFTIVADAFPDALAFLTEHFGRQVSV